MYNNFTYFAITSLIRSHILEFGSDKNTCSPLNLRFTSYALYQPFMRAFVSGSQSTSTDIYFHYSEI